MLEPKVCFSSSILLILYICLKTVGEGNKINYFVGSGTSVRNEISSVFLATKLSFSKIRIEISSSFWLLNAKFDELGFWVNVNTHSFSFIYISMFSIKEINEDEQKLFAI